MASKRTIGALSRAGFIQQLYALSNASVEIHKEMIEIMEKVRQEAIRRTPGAEMKQKWELQIRGAPGEPRFSVSVVNTDPRANTPLVSLRGQRYRKPGAETGTFTLLDLLDVGGVGWYWIYPFRKKRLAWVDAQSGRWVHATSVYHPPAKAHEVISAPRELGQRLVGELRLRARGQFRAHFKGRARRFDL